MNFITKNPGAFSLFLITIIAAGFAFYATGKDNKQKDNIEELGKKTKELGELNKSLGERIETIATDNKNKTDENNRLSNKNIDLTKQTQDLITKVEELTKESQELITKVDKRSKYWEEENLLSGPLNIDFKMLPDNKNDIKLHMGLNTMKASYERLTRPNGQQKKGVGIGAIYSDWVIWVKLDKNNNILFNSSVFDVEGNLLVEIENNNWRINRNYIAKFNYDSKGFEAIDNKGNIVLSVDIDADKNYIQAQGIFSDQRFRTTIIVGDSTQGYYPKIGMESLEVADRFDHYLKFNMALQSEINKIHFRKLFDYSGDNWLHKRSVP